MKSNKKFIILLEILVITFLVMGVVPVCGLSDYSADISAYPSIVNAGDEISVTYSGAPGFYWDYIAIYKVGEQDIYEQGELGGVIHLLEGKKSGTLIFTAPDEPGDYEFRLFEDDGYTEIARSNIVKVQEGTTQTSEEAVVLFEGNFDDGYAPGFGNEVGDWDVHLLYPYTGMYTATTGTFRFSMAGDTNWQDHVIEADFFNAQDGGLLVRAQDQDNCIALIVRPASNEIGWNVRKGGSWGATGLEVATLGHEPGEDLHVKVEVAGSEFKAYVNGVLKTTLNTTEHPNGKIGLYLGKQSDQYWDNVVVYSSGAAGSTPTTLPPTAEGGLVAYYTFNGDTLDHSENENNGTNHGATFVSGISGQALSFDGKGDYVQVPDIPSLDIASNNISLTAWVYFPEFVPDYGTVIEKTGSGGWNSYGVFSKNEKLSFWLYKESIEAHTAVSANQWVHFVATYDGINMQIYINGALDVERAQPGIDIKENNMPLMIGADPFDGGDYCHILIDEVKIYNYALSADEIKALYDGKEPSAPSSTPTTTPVIPSTGDQSPLPFEEIQFDFNDGRAQNWLDDGSGCWAVSDGAYVMTGNNGGLWRYSYYDQKFCNFEFQVDMQKLSGDSSENNFSYGVSFRSDGTMDNRYSFTISKGGGYCIGKMVNGTSTKIKDWTKSSALNAGFEHWNTLGVVAKGSSLKFYANGILLHDIQDTAFSCGLVGLHAYDPTKSDCPDTVQFDKITIISSTMKPDDYRLQESQVIGHAGETFAVDDFSLTIPPGAFDSEVELKLYASSEDRPFSDHGVTRTFRLEGLPADFYQPLQLRIQYQGTLSEESFIAVGEDALILGSGELETMYDLYPATESSGYLICELPAREGGTEAYQANYLKACTNGDPFEEQILYLLGITDYRTYKSKHFNITYPRYVEEVVVPHLGDYLEDAYDTFKQMGFNYERHGFVILDISMVDVLIRDINGGEVYANGILNIHWVWGTPLKSRCTFKMEFNERKMAQANLPKLRIAAGREFFEAIPPLYARSASHLGDFMIDEAVAIWSAEKFTEEPNYIPPEFIGNEMAMFHGMYSGILVVGPGHDKGMSAMIKYLVDYHGERALVKTYEGIATGLRGTDAILNSIDDPVNKWWPDFFKEYVSGNIYDVSSDVFTNPKNLAGTFNIKPEGEDTVEFFPGEYYDLSAKIYRINLPHSSKDIDSDAEIGFVVNSVDVALDDLTLLVFGLKDGRLQYFDDWTITNVKGLTEEGWDLIVVVVNSKYNNEEEDWYKLSEIELKVELVTTYTMPEGRTDVSSRFLAVLPADFIVRSCTYYPNLDYLWSRYGTTLRDYPLGDRDVASIWWYVVVQIQIYSTDKEVPQGWKGILRDACQHGGQECIISDDRIVKGPYIAPYNEDINTYDRYVALPYKNSIIEINVCSAPTKEECESVADAVEGVAKRIIDENLLTEQMP